MNRIEFNQTGGFPLETETLSNLQDSYSIFQAFGELVGKRVIVKGCVQSGSNISNGVIYWDGELVEFVGGTLQSKIVLVEEVTSREFEDGEVKPVYYKRHATFGTGVGAVLWSDFKRAYPLSSAIFIDDVRMYAGSVANIPAGWHLCNGSNATVDLRDRFIVGYNPANTDYNAIGKTGGAKEVTLTMQQIPSHGFSGTVEIPDHTHGFKIREDGYSTGNGPSLTKNTSGNDEGLRNFTTESGGGSTASFTTNNKGGGESHENRPPWFALAFIQFKGI